MLAVPRLEDWSEGCLNAFVDVRSAADSTTLTVACQYPNLVLAPAGKGREEDQHARMRS